jgi:predicted  nucleic acid-binding Zn-ribbon protein
MIAQLQDAKPCTKCSRVLPLSSFSKQSSKKDGVRSYCKDCGSAYSRRYAAENAEAVKKQRREYIAANHEKVKANLRDYYQRNKEACLARNKRWAKANPELFRSYRKKLEQRALRDPVRAVMKRAHRRTKRCLQGSYLDGVYLDGIGCDAECLRKHIELLFPDGMGWHNMPEWSIDHFYPMAAVRKNADWLSVAAVCNYRNLRPVWRKENSAKRDTVIQEALALHEAIKELISAGLA